MVNRAMALCTFGLAATVAWISPALGHYSSGVEFVGERTASFLASPFVAAFDPAPLAPRLQVDPSGPLPPGMCRWERFVLDSSGRPILDQYGRPLKEYAIGSCLAPPY